MTRETSLQRIIERLDVRITALQARSNELSQYRLISFVVGFTLSIAALLLNVLIGSLISLLALGIFVAIVRVHNRVNAWLRAFKIWRRRKAAHLARLQLDWDNIPATPSPTSGANHPFELDIDITGLHSLHQLMDTADSREGSLRLRDWLLTTEPDYDAIQKRQALVKELIPQVIFRDKIHLKSRLAGQRRWDGESIGAWLDKGQSPESIRPRLLILIALAVTNIALLIPNILGLIPPFWGISALAYIWVFVTTPGQRDLFGEAKVIGDALEQIKAVFAYLETYPHQPHVSELCAPFRQHRPSTTLNQLSAVMSAASIQRNPFAWLALNAVVPWDIGVAYRLNQLRAELAQTLPQWLDILYDLEALIALANFAHLNPDYTFPTVTQDEMVFRGEQFGHPLIRDKVCNDFAFDHLGQAVIITGSNMSGKSSFLRTLGLNLVLAYAGGVVNAQHFETALFRLYSSIRVTDSITDGFSYFYAEVRRLKSLLEALEDDHPYPLFFLIDEIFRGTNNRERLIGSRSYIRALVDGHGVGLISTHDLELVQLADEMSSLSNYHFREHVREGRMVFDYQLRGGPSPTTNALKIMQLEGLPVEGSI